MAAAWGSFLQVSQFTTWKERGREKEGRGEQGRGKKIRYSLVKNYYQYNDYSLQQDLLQ